MLTRTLARPLLNGRFVLRSSGGLSSLRHDRGTVRWSFSSSSQLGDLDGLCQPDHLYAAWGPRGQN